VNNVATKPQRVHTRPIHDDGIVRPPPPPAPIPAAVYAEAESVVHQAMMIASGYVDREAFKFWTEVLHEAGSPVGCLPSPRIDEIMRVAVPAAVMALNSALDRAKK
jgi:hypothetical protein